MKSGPPGVFPVLLAIQGAAGLLAAGWGALRGIDWWTRVHLDWTAAAAAAGGLGLSAASTRLFVALQEVEWLHLRWVLQRLLVPLFRGTGTGRALLLASLSGFAEEALFRGVLLPEIGLVGSSLLFGLLHTGDRRLAAVGVWAAAVGFLLGWLYQATGNLAVPMALHAGSNLLSLLWLGRLEPQEP